jgi:hypothetical protein
MIIFSCDMVAAASSLELQIREKAPARSPYKPMFLAYDWERAIWCPSFKNILTGVASLSISPNRCKRM